MFFSRHLGHMTKMATTPIYGNQKTNGSDYWPGITTIMKKMPLQPGFLPDQNTKKKYLENNEISMYE